MKKEKLCFNCGRPVKLGRRLCEQHLEHQRAMMAKFRANRKKKGLCSRCKNPALRLPNGKASTLCKQCRAHVRELEAKNRTELKNLKNALQ